MNNIPESVWYAAKTLRERCEEKLQPDHTKSVERDSWLCVFLVSDWALSSNRKPAGIEENSVSLLSELMQTKRQLEHLERKVAHGCTDATCEECDK